MAPTRIRAVPALAGAAIALGLLTSPASATTVRSERTLGLESATCSSWARWMSYELALYGIFGAAADSYIAQRLDNPCHSRITPRSAFHAGDPA